MQRSPKLSSAWSEISDIAKALAPVWVLVLAAGVAVGGVLMVVYANDFWAVVGGGLIALGWVVMGLGWGPACDLSRRILG